MRTMRMAIVAALGMASVTALPASMAQVPVAVETIESGYSGTAARWGNLVIASQPDVAELVRLSKSGTVTVINLRTPPEMEALGYDEAELVRELGMDYVSVPLDGRDFPHTPAALDAVASAIAAADGKPVLLHCASSARASHMFAAWLIQARNMPVDQAIKLARQIGLSALPVENLLGTTFRMDASDT